MKTHMKHTKRTLRLVLPAIAVVLAAFCVIPAAAQTYHVIHTFTGHADGGAPTGGVILDAAGNLYGTASEQTSSGNGVVFKLSRSGSHWLFAPIYNFHGQPDGSEPDSRVIFGPDGALYGTTFSGGAANQGTVYRLAPQPTLCHSFVCPWGETILYSFQGAPDGAGPAYGDLLILPNGTIYGTTAHGGIYQDRCMYSYCGTAYQLQHVNGSWQESVIYQFTSDTGYFPLSGFVTDSAGNLYSTLWNEGNGGTVFELSPFQGAWAETALHKSGYLPSALWGGVIFDHSGNLIGSYAMGGGHHGGEIFQLTHNGDIWTYNPIYDLTGIDGQGGPTSSLTMDAQGNLYGTANGDPDGCGSVFKLTQQNGVWTYTSLYDFNCLGDGGNPTGVVAIDAAGNLYGTTVQYGGHNLGVVWEITP